MPMGVDRSRYAIHDLQIDGDEGMSEVISMKGNQSLGKGGAFLSNSESSFSISGSVRDTSPCTA